MVSEKWAKEKAWKEFNHLHPVQTQKYFLTRFLETLSDEDFQEWRDEVNEMYRDRFGTINEPEAYDGYD